MQQLPNNCRVGKFSVTPSNWDTPDADPTLTWRIVYWFYDDNLNQKKQVPLKGMNHLQTVKEKQAITKDALKKELEYLKNGYNPIIGKTIEEEEEEHGNILPSTPFITALRQTLEKLTCVHSTILDIKSTIKYIAISARALKYNTVPIGDIRRRHIKRILEHCSETKKRWSHNTYNAYRKNLGILFKELVEQDAMETNVTRDISKKKTIRRIKRILTPAECKRVSDWVKNYDRRFWLLIHIFFHSGCRTTEIFRVKRKHVNLENQTVLITVLKGNQPFEVEKPIKNIAVSFWEEAIKGAKDEDFIFARGLKPGVVAISPRQATRRWKRHIKGSKKKGKLGIICDWYSLKYLNSDQVSKAKGLKTASLLNSHTNTNTTRLYTVNEEERMNEEIRQVANAFA